MRKLLPILSILLLSGCSAYQVSYNRKPHTDFSVYKTYAWLPPDSTIGKYLNRKYINDRIHWYSNQELNLKGMSINTENPDVLFQFSAYTIDHVDYQYTPPPVSIGIGFGGPRYYMGYAAPVGTGVVTSRTYKTGTLVIEMLLPSTGEILWKGVVSKALDPSPDIDSELQQAIKRVYFSLPIKQEPKNADGN
jgi:hypothetical protein